MFELLTPISYWVITAIWLVIIVLYLGKLKPSFSIGGTVTTLLIILSIDAFRTLFESVYFGLYFNSLFGFLPKAIYDVLADPAFIIIPKVINIIAGFIVLFILYRRWLPTEIHEREEAIQDLKAAKKIAEEHEANLSAILDSISDAIVFTDLNRQILSVNRGMYKTFGYTLDDLQGQDTSILYESKDEFIHQGKLRFNLSAKEKLAPYEVNYRRKNGDVFMGETLGVPVYDSGHTIQGYLGVIRDISERKRYEIELSQHQLHLEEMVKERTEKLQKAMQVAEEANNAKSTFLSNMSHELRTPLNAILGFAQLLEINKKEPLSKTQKEHVKQIRNGGDHLLNLINDVLDLAKIEAGKASYAFETIDPRDLIDECLSFQTTVALNNQITIKDQSEPSLPFICADYMRCKQAILNLMSNAIKYNHVNGSIIVKTEIRPDNFLRISITDTGQGIPDEKQPLLFHPFERLDAEKSGIEGTGIGLILTQKLIEEMKGVIGFSSHDGEGSTFWIELPLATKANDN
jgi:PAS domain S-box-containing protein